MSITLIEGNRAVTMGSSNDLAVELAAAHYQAGQGLDHDILAQALNELYLDRGQDHPLVYHRP